jgi:excisionase family DNA binding protein
MARPAEHYVHADGQLVLVPAKVAHWLGQHGLDALRVRARGEDPEVDAVLSALRLAALTHTASAGGSTSGSLLVNEAEVPPSSEWMSTGQAADALGVTPRAVRLACKRGRLPAEQVDGRWRITRTSVSTYRAARAA